jgi:cysteine synthase
LFRRQIAQTEGLLLGWASAAALSVAREWVDAQRAERAVAIVLDAGDRYFSRDAEMAAHNEALRAAP